MFNQSHTTGSMNNVFRAIVSVIVTVLTAVIRFTVRLKEILNGILTWVYNAYKATRNFLGLVGQYFSQVPSRMSCAWRCLATHPLLYNQKCLCQVKIPPKKSKSASKWQRSKSFFAQNAEAIAEVTAQAAEFIRAHRDAPEAAALAAADDQPQLNGHASEEAQPASA